jgi:hypothetical protein
VIDVALDHLAHDWRAAAYQAVRASLERTMTKELREPHAETLEQAARTPSDARGRTARVQYAGGWRARGGRDARRSRARGGEDMIGLLRAPRTPRDRAWVPRWSVFAVS